MKVPAFGLMLPALTVALPIAGDVSLRAERHGAGNGYVTRIVMASTVLAFGRFTMRGRGHSLARRWRANAACEAWKKYTRRAGRCKRR